MSNPRYQIHRAKTAQLIAQQFCVGVIGMYHSGLGGGGFMLVRSSNGSYEFIDFREMAPAAAFETMYSPPLSNSNYSLYGGLASGVPGELRGLEYLHKKYAALPWKHLMQPAIKVARYGFNVTADLVRYMASATAGSYDFLTFDETWALDFAPNGTRLGLGDIMTRKRYANTLESIAEYGADAFYHGAIANTTITALQKSNGTMTLSDLANYTVEIRQTSNITYRGFKMHSGSAPSSGAVVMSIMKIVEGYDMSTPSQLNFSTHYMDEAMRFAYGQRTLLGDPTFSPNITDYQLKMYSETTAEEVRSNIEEFHTLNASAYDPDGYGILTDSGTSAAVASDRSGLTIAITSTINTLFGSQLMVPETGVIMNNEMNGKQPPLTMLFTLETDLCHRFQYSQHHKCIRLHPHRSELHQTFQTASLLHLPYYCRIPKWDRLHLSRFSGRVSHHHRSCSTPLARA
jgi:gamma-glutamyltranspeptidase/glutathione hydrolase